MYAHIGHLICIITVPAFFAGIIAAIAERIQASQQAKQNATREIAHEAELAADEGKIEWHCSGCGLHGEAGSMNEVNRITADHDCPVMETEDQKS